MIALLSASNHPVGVAGCSLACERIHPAFSGEIDVRAISCDIRRERADIGIVVVYSRERAVCCIATLDLVSLYKDLRPAERGPAYRARGCYIPLNRTSLKTDRVEVCVCGTDVDVVAHNNRRSERTIVFTLDAPNQSFCKSVVGEKGVADQIARTGLELDLASGHRRRQSDARRPQE